MLSCTETGLTHCNRRHQLQQHRRTATRHTETTQHQPRTQQTTPLQCQIHCGTTITLHLKHMPRRYHMPHHQQQHSRIHPATPDSAPLTLLCTRRRIAKTEQTGHHTPARGQNQSTTIRSLLRHPPAARTQKHQSSPGPQVLHGSQVLSDPVSTPCSRRRRPCI